MHWRYLITCEECHEHNCTFRGKFDSELILAHRELRVLHGNQLLRTPEEYWREIDDFYAKHSPCVLKMLDQSAMYAYSMARIKEYKKMHSNAF